MAETSESSDSGSIWRSSQFRAYLNGTAFSGLAFAMQQLLINWILVGILLLPADQVGLIQAVIGIPGVFLMLMGGASADRSDPRNLLIGIYFVAPIFPLFLIAMHDANWFNVWTVMVWGLGIGVAQSYSMPAQQAILNRITGSRIQEGVTAATVAGFVVQVVGLAFAGQIDRVGVAPVLIAQALALGLAGWAMTRVVRAPGPASVSTESALQGIAEGLKATYRHKVILQVLVINFVSSIFNAGSFLTVFPFIVKRVYQGDALDLSGLMALFFAGAAISNAILLRFMPLARPGRLYLMMQLTRTVVLFLFYIEGDWWLLVLASFGWGLNMGLTSNLARTIVQESAEPAYRGRILSVFSVGMVGSAPIGAVILGWMIERFSTLDALWPAMILSVVLCVYGIFFTRIWDYRSAQPSAERSAAS
ncbi:MAG: MFS transporter [Pseudomonadota bacterium]